MGLGKGISGDIVDAGLFGSGPYAKMFGTAGPSGGGPGGLIGDAFGRLMGGGRDFGNPVPVEVVGVSGSGTANLLGSAAGSKDMISRILGGGLTGPYTATGSGPTPAAAAAAAAAGSSGIPFLDMISKAEGNTGYNTSLGYGKYLPGGVEQNLTGMTLDQIRGVQTQILNNPANTFNSSAVGRYQITRRTLDSLRTKLGLSGGELYDPAMQDALALNLAQMRGPNASGLTNEWAGLGNQSSGFMSQLLAMFPHFASGGPVSAGRPYVVGERGPEMFVPGSSGSIVPGGGITIIDRRVNAPPIQQRGNTLVIADHDKLMRSRYGIKPTQVGRT